MCSCGTSVVVGTTGSPYLATGSRPASYSMAKLELDQACVSKRSMVELHGVGVVYASPDGLVLVGYGGTRLATENHFTRDEWQLLRPQTIEGYAWEGRYLGRSEEHTSEIQSLMRNSYAVFPL